MTKKELLTGKWEPIHDYDFANGKWRIYSRYQNSKSYYIFDGEHFTSHGTGYYEDGKVHHYQYDETSNTIILPAETIKIITLNETRLILELQIDYFMEEEEKLRIALKPYPDEE